MEEELIDRQLEEAPKDVVLGIMRWWEKKRLLFNSIILGIVVLVVVTHFAINEYASISDLDPAFFIRSLFYFIFINICYCAGWGVQLLGYYYFKIQYDTKILDILMFVAGTLFTSMITYGGYSSYLSPHNFF